MSERDDLIEWNVPLTSRQAKNRLLTKGFVTAELHAARIAKLETKLAAAHRLAQIVRRLILACESGQPEHCYVLTKSGTLLPDAKDALTAYTQARKEQTDE